MTYFVEHRIQFKNGTETPPYRLLRTWKTVKGALRAGEAHALAMDKYYESDSIAQHCIAVKDDHDIVGLEVMLHRPGEASRHGNAGANELP